jgi:hypothetical protein
MSSVAHGPKAEGGAEDPLADILLMVLGAYPAQDDAPIDTPRC